MILLAAMMSKSMPCSLHPMRLLEGCSERERFDCRFWHWGRAGSGSAP